MPVHQYTRRACSRNHCPTKPTCINLDLQGNDRADLSTPATVRRAAFTCSTEERSNSTFYTQDTNIMHLKKKETNPQNMKYTLISLLAQYVHTV